MPSVADPVAEQRTALVTISIPNATGLYTETKSVLFRNAPAVFRNEVSSIPECVCGIAKSRPVRVDATLTTTRKGDCKWQHQTTYWPRAKPTEKPYYIRHVQHESVMTAKVTFADGTVLTLSATIADA